MNEIFRGVRRTLVAFVLAVTIACVSVSSAAVASEPGHGPGTPPSFVDGFWSMVTCAFAYGLAFQLRAPLESAAMICAYAFSVD